MKPKQRSFRIEDPNAAAILEMQGAKIVRPRLAGQQDILLLPEPLASDEYFNAHTLPYLKPGEEMTRRSISKTIPYWEGDEIVGREVVLNQGQWATPEALPWHYRARTFENEPLDLIVDLNRGEWATPQALPYSYMSRTDSGEPRDLFVGRSRGEWMAPEPLPYRYEPYALTYDPTFWSAADMGRYELTVTRNIPEASYAKPVNLPYEKLSKDITGENALIVTKNRSKAGFAQAVELPYFRTHNQLKVTATNPKAGFYRPSHLTRDYYGFDG